MAKRLKIRCPEQRLCPQACSDHFFGAIKACPLSMKIMAIRTICNAWTTSDRYHESLRLDCIFGCGLSGPRFGPRPKDILSHYLSCPCLWGIIELITGAPIPDSPPVALCIIGQQHPIQIALAHSIYHGLKQGNFSLIKNINNLQELNRVLDVAVELGSDAWSDLNRT